MLWVFAAAAILAIGLYEQMPRAAFEAQRDKEQLLIDHGLQYKRGVQLYVRKYGRYPAKIEDLDNTQNIRFLRKHYLDPMTGKDEWRLLHIGPNGKLIDSKIKKDDPNADQWHQGSVTEFKSASSSDDDSGNANASLATRKRPSDDKGTTVAVGGDPTQLASASSTPGGSPGTNPADPNAPKPGQPGFSGPQLPGQPTQNPAANSGNQSSVSGNGGYGAVSGNGGYPVALNPQTGQPVQQGQPGQPYNTAPGSNQPNNGNFGQQGTQTSAASMINGLLTQPRPGGAPPGVGGPGIGGTVMGGLAGVASNFKGRGIKTYNDQTDYPKWEFYYDLAADQVKAVQSQMNAAGVGTPGQQPFGQQTGAGQSSFGQSSTFSQPSSFGQSSSFGQQPAQQQPAPQQPPPAPRLSNALYRNRSSAITASSGYPAP